MAYLADTNVAARRVLAASPQFTIIRDAIRRIRANKEEIYITPQVLIEFHALATRPTDANGLGMTVAQARLEAQRMEAIFPLAAETPAIYPLWRALVDTYGVIGRQSYDARLVAVMQAHGITHILTLNPTHFRRFAEITVVEPQDAP